MIACEFGAGLAAVVLAKGEDGEVTLAFGAAAGTLLERLEAIGQMPLPPYIKRPKAGDPRDRLDYQTLFARRPGAVAAPTAALHFTPRLMAALAARGIDHAFLTLHVGAGTFLPVKALDTEAHRMHAEHFELGAETVAAIERTRAAGGAWSRSARPCCARWRPRPRADVCGRPPARRASSSPPASGSGWSTAC